MADEVVVTRNGQTVVVTSPDSNTVTYTSPRLASEVFETDPDIYIVEKTGPQGVPGPAGPAGTPGAAGAPGAAGVHGEDGRSGRDGQDGTPGPTGPAGPTGPSGAGRGFRFVQMIPTRDWIIEHALDAPYPTVTVTASDGRVIVGRIAYPDMHWVRIWFSSAVAGEAYLT